MYALQFGHLFEAMYLCCLMHVDQSSSQAIDRQNPQLLSDSLDHICHLKAHKIKRVFKFGF